MFKLAELLAAIETWCVAAQNIVITFLVLIFIFGRSSFSTMSDISIHAVLLDQQQQQLPLCESSLSSTEMSYATSATDLSILWSITLTTFNQSLSDKSDQKFV